ncbi:MAG: Ppx/GppA family phosphatase [Rhodoplanes sp.]|uniref:Ppx/GppA phosphatase family protein n=1 Tax=Rhodoplanes sp. TaxID=1968906 RepID=UPI00179780D6|nr:Ppx/GppA phosphatase family protein [Rhodoplanes sp.]NVO17517.1 Ppx/GppA family phosphatase [Rhodoplanes sp.]
MDQEAHTTGLLDATRLGKQGGSEQPGLAWPETAGGAGSLRTAAAHPATYAALDLGTNNCRLLVARPTGSSFRVVDAFSRIIRLGEGVSLTGRIGEAAIVRAVDALAVCRDKMRSRGVGRARLIATEACRAAENGTEFQARISEVVGLDLEIVDHGTEAELAATGCTPLMDPDSRGAILFDIGGGSSELVRLGRSEAAGRGPPKPVIQGWVSLPLGVVTLAERFGGVAVDRAVFDAMVAEVTRALADFSRAHGDDLGGLHMLGTSGTVTTIAGVHLELPRYDRRRVDGCWLRAHEITGVIDRLMAMSYDDRVANPCIGAERADLVLAGCAILEAIRHAFPCPRLRVADRGLREGMLVKMMRADGVWERR